MSVKTETTGAGEEKVDISANTDNFITQIVLVIYLKLHSLYFLIF